MRIGKIGLKFFIVPLMLIAVVLLIGRKYSALTAESALEEHKEDIIKISRKTGVWASVTAAQFILEGGNPVSELATECNNYFGIKWNDKYKERYPGSYSVKYWTKEADDDGNLVPQPAWFTYFPTVRDGIVEHSVIWWNGYYESELDVLYDLSSSRDKFVNAVGKGAYATDPKYTYKLKKCIADYNLDELDKEAFPDGRKFCGNETKVVGTYDYPNDGYNSQEILDISEIYEQNGKEMVIVNSTKPLPESYSGINPDEIESSSTENSIIKKLRVFLNEKYSIELKDFFKYLFLILGITLVLITLVLLFKSIYFMTIEVGISSSKFFKKLIIYVTMIILGMCFIYASYLVDI